MEFTDKRDKQTYAAVKIGEQIWMAENLNFAYPKLARSESETDSTESAALDSISFCYNNDPANCEKYGRLYTWAAALVSVAVIASIVPRHIQFAESARKAGTCPIRRNGSL